MGLVLGALAGLLAGPPGAIVGGAAGGALGSLTGKAMKGRQEGQLTQILEPNERTEAPRPQRRAPRPPVMAALPVSTGFNTLRWQSKNESGQNLR